MTQCWDCPLPLTQWAGIVVILSVPWLLALALTRFGHAIAKVIVVLLAIVGLSCHAFGIHLLLRDGIARWPGDLAGLRDGATHLTVGVWALIALAEVSVLWMCRRRSDA